MRILLIVVILITNFSSALAQMVLSGTATGSCDCYTLTNATNQAGSIWSPTTINLTNPFDFTFDINLGAENDFGADGIMFVLRQTGTTSGGIGNGLGYSGITNSIGVEVDTWDSAPTVPTDISSDHVAMSSNGTVNHNLIPPNAIPNIEDGTYHTFRAVWDPVSTELEIILDGTSIFTYTGDMVALFFGGNPNVYFGWTGGTGGVFNIQSVCMHREAEFSSDVPTACVGQTVDFTDLSTSFLNYNSDEAITWDWDFDDGGSSALENPSHTFVTDGTYTVSLTITDISGCSETVTHDIVITPGLDLTMTHTDVTCFGLDDGTGTATPTTGTGPYTYLWDDPLAQTTTTSTDLGPTTYNVVVTDALGCVGEGEVTILEPSELIITSSTSTNASCGLANGTITIVASGGTPALEYSINGGFTYFPTGDFVGLANGSYNIVVRDANGCTATTITVVALDSPLMIDDITTTDVSCGPLDDGTITIDASAGDPPFQYSIDGGFSFQPANFFDFLSAGTYTVVVMDDAGCTITEDVTVGSLSTVVFDDILIEDATCNGGSDGSIDILVSGGTAPYLYSIDGGFSFFPLGFFDGLAAGSYDIEVTDDAGCNVTETEVVGEPLPVVLDDVLITNVSCNGMSDAEFELVAAGGTPGYSYSNDGGGAFQISPIFNDLPVGTYSIVISDANGCLGTDMVDVTEPEPLVIDDVIIVDVTCNGLMDGEITVVASGGTTAYQYRVDGGPYQLSPTFTGLGGGAITVDVLDANNCFVSQDAFISEADPIVLTMGSDTTICLGGEAVLCPNYSGGTAPYSFIWDGVLTSECFTTSTIGVHTLQMEDVNGCTSETLGQEVFQYDPLMAFAASSMTICPGDDVVLAGEASGEGPGSFTYEWTNDIDGATLFGPVQNVNPMTTTTYTLTVSSGCENTGTSTVTITTYPTPTPIITADVTEGCEDLYVNLSLLADPALVVNIVWDFGDGTIGSGWDTPHIFTEAMCYDIALNLTTINGCEVIETFDDFICVWKKPIADFSYQPEEPDLFNTTVSFFNESEFADVYEWSLGDGTSSSEFNVTNIYPELGNEDYSVMLIATTDQGCKDTMIKKITINEVVVFYIPNAFTPNSDPFNQSFTPVFIPGFNPRDYHFMIFNRWGELVWESFEVNEAWDGTYINGFVEDDVFVWELTFRENSSDKKYRHHGHVTVFK